ncbi:hypothetical protein [Candidatus Neptunichlamydia sp. REUL1]|uniref:hypothetical protein n=1 Tax=Candidatus Neptunichlamydia sp. REUL1 TaxID=3064277 RepID=UPI00293134C8|nr:hypothetical protein [Candidatus Neptunochlamydia sp. REUL1]
MDSGVLTGCDERQEYLLKWWWTNYSKHNTYPVTFCDFGMSPSAQNWCKSKGTLISQHSIPMSNLSEGIESAPWRDTLFPLLWSNRDVWFRKAFVQQKSPYTNSIWIDLDCEVKKDVGSLFEMIQIGDGFAISHTSEEETAPLHERKLLKEGTKGVQTGVFAYTNTSPIIPAWTKWCQDLYQIDFAEETCLSHLLHEKPYDIIYFSRNYNWTTPEIPNPHALILHHASATRKRNLLAKIGFNG